MKDKIFYFAILFLVRPHCNSQTDTNCVLRFDFNDQQIKEVHNKVIIKPVGVSLTDDRFGNKKSALYIFGNPTSYLNLGTSNLLKPTKATFSMWVNIQEAVFSGKGYFGNPLLTTKTAAGEDFIFAYNITYCYKFKRFSSACCRDSLKETTIYSKDTVSFLSWHHMAFTYDNDYFCFYIDGELQGKVIKGFDTKFLRGDSVLLGRSTGDKNQRYSHAIVDDIRIFHRVLSEKDIQDLYHEPNPNRLKNIVTEVLKYGGIILILGLIIMILIIRNKRNLKRQKEYYEMNNKIKELEIKAIKTQMNPHFISNSMAAIQNLIYSKDYEKSSQYIAKLGFLMRQILDYSDETYISLEEELSIIKLNVELEQLRFDNNFEFSLHIEEGIALHGIMIPSLVTQPFVENAIWHGLLPLTQRTSHLQVRVYKKNKITFISIQDNGVGRSIKERSTEKKSRGMKLVADKIESINRLNNSIDFKLEIIDLFDENNIPNGTKIIIQLLNHTQEE